jgi:hypothetical protein
MATFHFSRGFIERCEEFVRNNPRVASSPQELIIRSGRMALHMLKEKFGDCEISDSENSSYKSYSIKRKTKKKDSGETVPIRIPDEDVNKVRQFIRKLGLGRTVISFYYFATWMVLLEIWKLPEKPPY